MSIKETLPLLESILFEVLGEPIPGPNMGLKGRRSTRFIHRLGAEGAASKKIQKGKSASSIRGLSPRIISAHPSGNTSQFTTPASEKLTALRAFLKKNRP